VRNATLLLLWCLMLALASTAAAQSDDDAEDATEGEAADEEADRQPAEESVDTSSEEASEPAGELSAPSSEAEEAEVSAEEAEEVEESEEAAEEEEAPAAPAQLPFRSTFFDWFHYATFNTFVRDGQLAYNPYYAQGFSLAPRWYIQDTTFLWANVQLSLEITDFDGGGVYNREPQLSDTLVEIRQVIPWEGFVFLGALRVGLPTSKASQAAQRFFQAGVGVTAVRPIPEAYLTIAGSFSYRHWFAGSNVVQTGEPIPQFCPGADYVRPVPGAEPEPGGVLCDQAGGVSTIRDTLNAGLTLTFAYESLSITAQYISINAYGHDLADAFIEVETRPEPLQIADGSPSHWRNFSYFTLAVSYQIVPWLAVTAGVQNHVLFAPIFSQDGSVRNPIFTPDTTAYLDFTVQLDSLYTEFAGSEEELSPEEQQRRRQGLSARPRAEGVF
jgi:hypothetical protein